MARLLLAAASAALLVSTSAAAAVLVVRSSGPSAAAYPPGKALPDTHMLKLKASDSSCCSIRAARAPARPGQLQRAGQRGARRGNRPTPPGPAPAGSGWGRSAAPERAACGRPISAVGQCLRRQSERADPVSRRCRQSADVTLTDADRQEAPRSISRPTSGMPPGRRRAGRLGQADRRVRPRRAGDADAAHPVAGSVGA
jgi:hypothetical protein